MAKRLDHSGANSKEKASIEGVQRGQTERDLGLNRVGEVSNSIEFKVYFNILRAIKADLNVIKQTTDVVKKAELIIKVSQKLGNFKYKNQTTMLPQASDRGMLMALPTLIQANFNNINLADYSNYQTDRVVMNQLLEACLESIDDELIASKKAIDKSNPDSVLFENINKLLIKLVDVNRRASNPSSMDLLFGRSYNACKSQYSDYSQEFRNRNAQIRASYPELAGQLIKCEQFFESIEANIASAKSIKEQQSQKKAEAEVLGEITKFNNHLRDASNQYLSQGYVFTARQKGFMVNFGLLYTLRDRVIKSQNPNSTQAFNVFVKNYLALQQQIYAKIYSQFEARHIQIKNEINRLPTQNRINEIKRKPVLNDKIIEFNKDKEFFVEIISKTNGLDVGYRHFVANDLRIITVLDQYRNYCGQMISSLKSITINDHKTNRV